MRRYWWAALAVLLAIVIYLTMWIITPAQQKALRYVQKGNYQAAITVLSKVKNPNIDIQATRLVLLVGLLGADAQIQREYDGLGNIIVGVEEQSQVLEKLQTENYNKMTEHSSQLQIIANDFAKKYQRDNPIKTPWQRGQIHLKLNEIKLEKAMVSLQSGILQTSYANILANALYRIGIYEVFRISMQQKDDTAITLSGKYYTPTLLFLIGSKVDDPILRTWYMSEVVAIAPSDHEEAKLAQEYLSR